MNLTWPSQIAWDWEPSVVAGCTFLLALYGWMSWRARGSGVLRWLRTAAFLLGDAIVLLALVSPLDTLADQVSFSAHMVQHLLLIEAAAPLLLLGIPGEWWDRWLRSPFLAAAERMLRRPGLAWTIGFSTIAFWHIPIFYRATLRIEPLHIVEHLLFLATAIVFWWPVLSPRHESRMPAMESILYLFSRMAANLVLGTLVAIAPVGIYGYAPVAAASMPWHLSPLNDQRLGGYLMWLPTLVIDMAAVPLLLALWFSHLEDQKAGHAAEASRSEAIPS